MNTACVPDSIGGFCSADSFNDMVPCAGLRNDEREESRIGLTPCSFGFLPSECLQSRGGRFTSVLPYSAMKCKMSISSPLTHRIFFPLFRRKYNEILYEVST